jgi:hypothetical protein
MVRAVKSGVNMPGRIEGLECVCRWRTDARSVRASHRASRARVAQGADDQQPAKPRYEARRVGYWF